MNNHSETELTVIYKREPHQCKEKKKSNEISPAGAQAQSCKELKTALPRWFPGHLGGHGQCRLPGLLWGQLWEPGGDSSVKCPPGAFSPSPLALL